MCAAVSSYAHACAAAGIQISGWRKTICGEFWEIVRDQCHIQLGKLKYTGSQKKHRRNLASLIEQRNVNGETNDFLSSDTSQNDCLLAKTGILYFYRLIQPVTMFSMLIKNVKKTKQTAL